MAPSSIPSAPGSQPQRPAKGRNFRSLMEIMKVAKMAENAKEYGGGGNYYSRVACQQCGSGERDDELMMCDRCDRGYHMLCLRPIVARIPIGPWFCPACSDDAKKRRRRSIVFHKKRRRLLPYISSENPLRRLSQMRSLASALTALSMEFSNELTYGPGMATKLANQAIFESGGMQVLAKEDIETLELCRAMYRRGECPPLVVTFDSCEGYTVEANGPIKDMTFIAEYTGDVDYIKNREQDDCDSMMTLLLATDPSKSLVVCPDKHGNIARFINGINNYTPKGRKKQNVKCVRYINGECRMLLAATRDISKGERLYYDYNGYEQEYPTHNFI